jgi:hypothetical protein
MSTTATVTTAMPYYKKTLEGVQVTDDMLRLWKECYSQVQSGVGSDSSNSKGELSKKQSIRILKDAPHPNQNPQWVPIDVVRAMQVLSADSSVLEQALQRTSLFFTPPPAPKEETREQRKQRTRMGKLRLQCEETKYVKLTGNLHQEEHDDINGRSMTYAASVGLNMIIAPISFGCFMYFFAGGVFDYFLGEEFSSRTGGGTDIKRVIVGVVSGVIMLFIEMTLFVIRTHEMEKHTTKKRKKRGVQPFGVYSKKGDCAAEPQSKQAQVQKQD